MTVRTLAEPAPPHHRLRHAGGGVFDRSACESRYGRAPAVLPQCPRAVTGTVSVVTNRQKALSAQKVRDEGISAKGLGSVSSGGRTPRGPIRARKVDYGIG